MLRAHFIFIIIKIKLRTIDDNIIQSNSLENRNIKSNSFETIIMTKKENAKAYWKENITYLFILLFIWFIVSYGAGILFKDALNSIRIGGFKLGFWFAQQGAMYVFVILIFVYVKLMNKLDKKYGYDV